MHAHLLRAGSVQRLVRDNLTLAGVSIALQQLLARCTCGLETCGSGSPAQEYQLRCTPQHTSGSAWLL